MRRDYWEQMAPSYDEEIFDVLKNDTKGIIRKAIKKYGKGAKSVMDIGCAIGKWLPVLSPLFENVVAVDISQKNLEIARKKYLSLTNIEYRRVDMSSRTKIAPCEMGICINAILTPSLKERQVFFASLSRCIRKGGHLVLTIPSLESWLLTSILQEQFQIEKKGSRKEKNGRAAIRKWNQIVEGNADIDKVPHKHYLKEELEILLNRAGFEPIEFRKIEYGWKTEFSKPPGWLKKPLPWDWMVVGRRK
jgi:SAM-dependent methyltransferase